MGLKNPVGTPAQVFGKKGTIVGVIKDYHFQSLHEPIRPLILDVKEHLEWGTILVRTEAGKTREALAGLEKVCKQINPGYPFAYSFTDEEYDKLYRGEQVIARLSNVFAGLAIFISCLGLLGLAMFSAEQRTKEIGIRKVLGASVNSIVALFSGDFLKLVALSFLIAAPLAGYAMNGWLEGFAYKIGLSWWIFAMAGGTALLVALLTVSFQAVKSALANPVNSLRSE
jgi:ABC-type antimicrobial peptide transport system permease subunit